MKKNRTVIGFTGTQAGMTEAQHESVRRIVAGHGLSRCHHGDCIGADEQFQAICLNLNLSLVIHIPDSDAKRAFCEGGTVRPPKPYLQRNRDIVDACDLLIAAPRECEEQLRSGTWFTVRYARRQKKPILIAFPDGSIRLEHPHQPTNGAAQ